MHVGLVARIAIFVFVGLTAVACQTREELFSVRGSGPAFFGSVLNADLTAREPDPTAGEPYGIQRVSADGQVLEQVYTGYDYTGAPRATDAGGDQSGGNGQRARGNGNYRLNFENAQIQEVVRAILGDALGANYVIDPEVSGRVTLSSARPISKANLIPILESLLRMNEAALLTEGDFYRVVYDSNVGNLSVGGPGRANPGYGLTVLPLRFVSAKTMLGLIDGFATRPDSIRVESASNMLLIVGTAAERRTAVETVLSFDTDWMADQSVAIYPVRQVRPETIIPELERIFDVQDGRPGAELIQFVPMARLKAILVVSSRSDLIRRAGTWVSRLDQQSSAVENTVHVYRVKYRDARLLVEILSGVFGGSVITTSAQDPGAQVQEGFVSFESSTEGEDLGEDGDEVEDLASQTGNTFDQVSDPIASTGSGSDLFSGGGGGGSGSGPRFSADTANNSVIVYADGDTYRKVLAALRQIDVPPLQVAVNVVIAEIRLNDELRYGVQYFIQSGDIGLDDDVGSIGLFNTVANTIDRQLPGFNFLIGSESTPDVIISAFDQITDVSVLSSPSLVVVENQSAVLQVGEEVAVTTRQSESVVNPDSPIVNEVEYRDTGIILNVTPRVAENGVISLTVAQEISDVIAGQNTLTPTFTKRRISSQISVASGQTVLLGGLIDETNELDDSGIPGLHRLKGVGGLFGTDIKKASRNELIVLIRPTVIRQGQDAQHVAEELRARMWNMQNSGLGVR